VEATWTGVGDAWRWTSTSVSSDPEGRASLRFVGIHRDATLTLDVDGVISTGDFAYLEALTIRQAPRPA
jgi:hypothetical protein